jgi:dTDP-4-dehydrorhamnose reductase
LYIQAYLPKPIIVRTSGVFGPGGLRTARGNFPELMLRLAREGKPIRVVEDHIASPTYAPMLASRSIDLLERDLDGIFHIGGGQPISWFEFARLIFAKAGVAANLTPTNEREYRTAANRPKFSALENARLRAHNIAPMPALAEALEEYFAARNQFTG